MTTRVFALLIITWFAIGASAQTPTPQGGGDQHKEKGTSQTEKVNKDKNEASNSPFGFEASQEATYEVRLKELRDEVNLLQSKVFEAKTRLLMLKERILHNLVSEAKLTIIHSNQVGMFLQLKQVAYYLDGDKIYGRAVQSGGLERGKEYVIYRGSVSPTHHILNVEMLFEGTPGVFSYLKGYKFKVRGSLPFTALKGHEIVVKVVGYQKGGLTRLEESPSIRFEVKRINLRSKKLKQATRGE